MVCHVVLNRGAVADSVNRAKRGSIKAKMGIGFKSMLVFLNVDLIRDAFAKLGLG